MQRWILVILAALTISNSVHAQSAGQPNEGLTIALDPSSSTYSLSWWAKAGRTYFIQQSSDLFNWNFMPLMETANEQVISWGITSTANELFFRLQYTDTSFIDWEIQAGLDPSQWTDPTALAPSGNGLTILLCYQLGLDPFDWYKGQTVILSVASGDGQTAAPGTFLAQPIVVSATKTDGSPWSNAPITFVADGSLGGFATVNDGSQLPVTNLTVQTNGNGTARAYFQPASSLTGTAYATASTQQAAFTVSGYSSYSYPPGTPVLKTSSISPTQTDLSWTTNSTNGTGTVIQRWTFTTGWQTIASPSSLAGTYSDTSVPQGMVVAYRVLTSNASGLSPASNPQSTTGEDLNSRDTDGDGLSDLEEIAIGSNPDNKDTNNDGKLDNETIDPVDPDFTQPRVPETCYAVVDLDRLKFVNPIGINDSLQILDGDPTAGQQVQLWTQGQFAAVPPPPVPAGNTSYYYKCLGPSNSGQIVYNVTLNKFISASRKLAYVWSQSGGFQQLTSCIPGLSSDPATGNSSSTASSISPGGVVAGSCVGGTMQDTSNYINYYAGAVWGPNGTNPTVVGSIKTLTVTNGVQSLSDPEHFTTLAGNDSEIVVGWTENPSEVRNFDPPAALWQNGQVARLTQPPPGYSGDEAVSINNSSPPIAVGNYSTEDDYPPAMWVQVGSAWKQKDFGPWDPNLQARSPMNGAVFQINDRCEVVGQFNDENYNYLGGLWQNGHAVDLDSRTPGSGYKSFYPYAINNNGAMLAAATRISDGKVVPVLLIAGGIVPDYNRDGVIDDQDRTKITADQPYRFWINDTNDSGDIGGDDIPGNGTNGYGRKVNGLRDLLDFFPFQLDLKQMLSVFPSAQYDYVLQSEQLGLQYLETTLTKQGVGNYLRGTLGDPSALDNPNGIALASVRQITGAQAKLSAGFLSAVQNDTCGIILVEAFNATSKPLKVVVRDKSSAAEVAQAVLPIKVDGIEQMYRHLNLLSVCGQTGGTATNLNEPSNYPDNLCSSKCFVFLHGYNVNAEQARGWNAGIFKRLWWSGSKARFVGVTWYGSQTQEQTGGLFTPNYHVNVQNAFSTAPALKVFLDTVQGDKTVAAHSLGNMVVSSALNDYGASINRYLAIDAAVAIEAWDGTAPQSNDMVHLDWDDPNGKGKYPERLWASEWFNLWPNTDARSKLTWRNRLSTLQTDVYNFYSSGEEVLDIHPHDQAPDILDIVTSGTIGRYAWALQEKMKGRTSTDVALGSHSGGWGFSSAYDTNLDAEGNPLYPLILPDPAATAQITDDQLRTTPFFRAKTIVSIDLDPALFGQNGDQYAQQNQTMLLARAFPSRTLAIGKNHIDKLAPPNAPDRNFDMNAVFQTGWPSSRLIDPNSGNQWFHSDARVIPYVFIHQLFEKFVELGTLDK